MTTEAEAKHPLTTRWATSSPKRLLALDGGGVRGVVSLAFLKRIETLLRERHGPGYTLADHFDLIGGTSTGAIIAAALASGKEVDWIQAQYRELAEDVFSGRVFRWVHRLRRMFGGVVVPKFRSKTLSRHLHAHFDFPLGSDQLKTGLMIMIRRADTASPWPIHNNPAGKYYNGPPPDSQDEWTANKDFSVAKLVLASAAAPSYFKPQRLVVGRLPSGHKEVGLFVDGGVSPHNNPALALLRLALLTGYGFNWEPGVDRLEVVSIGTGSAKLLGKRRWIAAWFAIDCLKALMDDCADEVELTLQWMSRSPTARRIDREVGNLSEDLLGMGPVESRPALLKYLRYNILLDGPWIKKHLGVQLRPAEIESLRKMDRPQNLDRLTDLADRAAQQFVLPENFAATVRE